LRAIILRTSLDLVAVVALRQLSPRQSGLNERRGARALVGSLRRWTRRYSSQRDEFHHLEKALIDSVLDEGGIWS